MSTSQSNDGTRIDALLSQQQQQENDDTTIVPISELIPADTPRTSGINVDHVDTLRELADQLPPIIVHRATMRVIDGMHRLTVAVHSGADVIRVRYFDGDASAAFVLGVRANVAHGMPLTRGERTAAATRIVQLYPQWSDRMIAAAAGLSPKTVGAIRHRSGAGADRCDTRIGRDGRVRQLKYRPRAAEPSAGAAPEPDHVAVPTQRSANVPEYGLNMRALRRDPSLRLTEAGRLLLRLLDLHALGAVEVDRMVSTVPPHCVDRVVDMAGRCSAAWQSFAERLAQKAAGSGGSGNGAADVTSDAAPARVRASAPRSTSTGV